MTDNKDVATSWLEGLAARGVSAIVTNGRLRILPSSAYKSLTDEELITLRHHRAAIKAVINAGVSFDVVRAAPIVAKPTPAPEPLCEWCHKSPTECNAMRDERPDVFDVIHGPSPEVTAKRDAIATKTMFKTMGTTGYL